MPRVIAPRPGAVKHPHATQSRGEEDLKGQ